MSTNKAILGPDVNRAFRTAITLGTAAIVAGSVGYLASTATPIDTNAWHFVPDRGQLCQIYKVDEACRPAIMEEIPNIEQFLKNSGYQGAVQIEIEISSLQTVELNVP